MYILWTSWGQCVDNMGTQYGAQYGDTIWKTPVQLGLFNLFNFRFSSILRWKQSSLGTQQILPFSGPEFLAYKCCPTIHNNCTISKSWGVALIADCPIILGCSACQELSRLQKVQLIVENKDKNPCALNLSSLRHCHLCSLVVLAIWDVATLCYKWDWMDWMGIFTPGGSRY